MSYITLCNKGVIKVIQFVSCFITRLRIDSRHDYAFVRMRMCKRSKIMVVCLCVCVDCYTAAQGLMKCK